MSLTNYDSDFCGKLPIQLTNLIQPYGILLVVDKTTYEIVQGSDNTEMIFSENIVSLIGTKMTSFIAEENFKTLQDKLASNLNPRIPCLWDVQGSQYAVLVHNKENFLLVEIDSHPIYEGQRETFIEIYQELNYAMSAIESTSSLKEACELTAKELKRISGFDKVMVYSFDREWNGTVMAEEREPDMESYMGFTFPASDIPRQARQLYLKNPYRLIPDRTYTPVKLHPVVNPFTGTFIDLSDCNLRSVPAVHIEYLKNMGVVASMSTRILHRGELWGLIACHHKTAKPMSYELCSVFELLSGIISMKITSLQANTESSVDSMINATYAALIENVYRAQDLESTLFQQDGVLKLFSAQGAAMSKNGRFTTIGEVPRRDQLEELLLWLHTRQLKGIFHTDNLSGNYEHAKDHADKASGILVIPINAAKDNYLIVFRSELVRVINWGGNPEERIQFEKDQKNYHPRNSFKQWQQKVNGISLPWKKEELNVAEKLRSFIFEYENSMVQ